MLNLLRFLLALVTLTIFVGSSQAYVVIDNINADEEALGSSATGVDSSRDRATGVVAGDQSDNISTDNDLLFPVPNAGKSGKKSRNRPAERTQLNYTSTNNSRRNRGGGGAGGGASSRRSTPRRNTQDNGFHQPIVTVSEPEVQPSQPSGDAIGMNVTHFDGPATGGSGGASGASGGGDKHPKEGEIYPEEDKPGHSSPGPTVSGTPEPAALAVWAIVGCCGYGFIRFRQRQLPLK